MARIAKSIRAAIDHFLHTPPHNKPFYNISDQGSVSRKPRKLFGPVKQLQNLEPCEYRAGLVAYSKDEGRFPSYKKFQVYTLLRF